MVVGVAFGASIAFMTSGSVRSLEACPGIRVLGQSMLAKAAALCLAWPVRSSLTAWAISRAPSGNSTSRDSRPTPVIRMATSTSTSVIPERRVIVASPVLLGSQPAAARVARERVGIAATGIDSIGTDLAGPGNEGDQRLLIRLVRIDIAHPEEDLAIQA